VPTLAEAGVPDQESEVILGVLLPGATPLPIIERLHREIVRSVAQPEMKERLAAVGFEAVGSTPAEFADRIKAEIAKWGKVIREANIKAQ
jgi:tripartite-type tricarboxylate transporter receptor subunit TctC